MPQQQPPVDRPTSGNAATSSGRIQLLRKLPMTSRAALGRRRRDSSIPNRAVGSRAAAPMPLPEQASMLRTLEPCLALPLSDTTSHDVVPLMTAREQKRVSARARPQTSRSPPARPGVSSTRRPTPKAPLSVAGVNEGQRPERRIRGPAFVRRDVSRLRSGRPWISPDASLSAWSTVGSSGGTGRQARFGAIAGTAAVLAGGAIRATCKRT